MYPDHPFLLPVLFLIGFIASFIGNFVSGGNSLISLSSMLFLGIPPQLAMATHSIGALGWRLGGLKQFFKAKKIVWPFVFPLCVIGSIGSVIGAHILITMDEGLLNKITGILILLIIPVLFLKKDLGLERQEPTLFRKYIGFLFYFLLSIWAGFFSAGTGVLFMYIYLWFFGLSVLETKGTDRIPGMVFNISTIIILLSHGIYELSYLLAFLPGTFLGGVIGTRYAIRMGDKDLKNLTLLMAAFIGISLLFRH